MSVMVEQELVLAEASAAPTRTLVVCDDPLYGEGVKVLLEVGSSGPVYSVESIQRAHRFCASDTATRRHTVLWFVDALDHETFGPVSGLRQLPSTGLCVVANTVDVRLVEDLVRERAGWFSVLLRAQKPSIRQLARTLEQLEEGSATVDCRVLQRMTANGRQHALSNLNAMDERVLELLASGLRNGEIARQTRRSEKAVEKHVGRLFAKLGLHARESAHLDRRVAAARLFYCTRRIGAAADTA